MLIAPHGAPWADDKQAGEAGEASRRGSSGRPSPSAGRFLCHSRRRRRRRRQGDQNKQGGQAGRRGSRAGRKRSGSRAGTGRQAEEQQQGEARQAKGLQGGQRLPVEAKVVAASARLRGPLSHAHIICWTRTQAGRRLDENLVAHFGNCALKCLRRDKINVGCSRSWSWSRSRSRRALTAAWTVIHGLLSALCRRTL